ncbi:MAG: hypothetical protein R2789_00870 [Microthrixaceae bacterium]
MRDRARLCREALGIAQIGLVATLAFFPPTAVVQNPALALGGLGVLQAAFVYFFSAIGVSNADAIALGLLVYVVFVISSLAGSTQFREEAGSQAAPSARSG